MSNVFFNNPKYPIAEMYKKLDGFIKDGNKCCEENAAEQIIYDNIDDIKFKWEKLVALISNRETVNMFFLSMCCILIVLYHKNENII